MKVIITGATGMVGEGVLFECLENTNVTEVLIVGRRHYDSTSETKRTNCKRFFQDRGVCKSVKRL